MMSVAQSKIVAQRRSAGLSGAQRTSTPVVVTPRAGEISAMGTTVASTAVAGAAGAGPVDLAPPRAVWTWVWAAPACPTILSTMGLTVEYASCESLWVVLVTATVADLSLDSAA